MKKLILFRTYLKYGGKIIHSGRYVYLRNVLKILNFNFFKSPIYSNLPYNATELERFLKYIRIFVCFCRATGDFLKTNWNFFIIGKCGKFAYQMFFFLKKCLFHLNCEILQKLRNFSSLENLKIYDFFRKTFSSF